MTSCQRLATIAALAAAVLALAAAPSTAGQIPTKPNPHNVATPMRNDATGSGIVTVAERGPPLVRILRGNGRRSGRPGTIEIVNFTDSREPRVRVVRGGAALSATPAAQDKSPLAPEGSRADGEMVVAFADPRQPPVTVLRGRVFESSDIALFSPTNGLDLDRVAFAVDGAESSHGTDQRMWRPDLDGPQGPMQVSAAAAFDLGGGDRFDLGENRSLGRAYLARLYGHYGNWPDAIAAYNWGPGNLDGWIAGGRPADALPLEVEHYRDHVLHETGLPTTAIPPGK